MTASLDETRERLTDLRGRSAAYWAYAFTFGILALIAVWLRPAWYFVLFPLATALCIALAMKRGREARDLEEELRARRSGS